MDVKSSRADRRLVRLRAARSLGLLVGLLAAAVTAAPPAEPLDIGYEPQFVFDHYVVDNHWAIKYKREAVQRVFHTAAKHPANPILDADLPSYLWVVRGAEDGLFRMWYQANTRVRRDNEEGRKFRTDIAYAESEPGWTAPL